MKALVFERKLAKYAAATVAGRFAPGSGAKYGPLSLKDVRVRHALSKMIDRDTIVARVMEGEAVPAGQSTSPHCRVGVKREIR